MSNMLKKTVFNHVRLSGFFNKEYQAYTLVELVVVVGVISVLLLMLTPNTSIVQNKVNKVLIENTLLEYLVDLENNSLRNDLEMKPEEIAFEKNIQQYCDGLFMEMQKKFVAHLEIHKLRCNVLEGNKGFELLLISSLGDFIVNSFGELTFKTN